MSAPADKFLLWPDKRLKDVAAPVDGVDDNVRAIWDRMLDMMYAMPGVGLAAPQIGVGLRLAVLDCETTGRAPVRLANPEVIELSPELSEHEEASPNLPGVWAKVRRPKWALVAYVDERGFRTRRKFEGLWATSVQHQIDHLDGKLFIDRLSPVKRKMVLDKFRKLQRKR